MNSSWLNRSLYPFESKFIDLPAGKMHHIDQGTGETIVFVHGTPAWSFLYRAQIKSLSRHFRCVAMDHLGFGMSDKPVDFAGTPQAHSANLELLIEKLGIGRYTLVVHDFGGPIGLSCALRHPHKISRLVILNTWLWETTSKKEARQVDKLLQSWAGKFLYLNLNFSPKVLFRQAFFDKTALTPAIHQHYIDVFPDKNSRHGLLRIGQSLVGSSDWYQEQFQQLPHLQNTPTLIIWGIKDKFIQTDYLERWKKALPHAQVSLLEAGHFLQEEKPNEVTVLIGDFMKTNLPGQLS